MPRRVSLGCLVLCLATTAVSADWPQFRGPAGTGRLDKLEHPATWGKDNNIAWAVELPGGGWSSPVVAGDRVFVTAAVAPGADKPKGFLAGVMTPQSMGGGGKAPDKEFAFQVLCLDRATGKTLWSNTTLSRKPPFPTHPSNSFATESPAADGDRVYAWFGSVGTAVAFDREGKEVWKKLYDPQPTGNGFGTGSSLALADGRLFIQCDNEAKSYVAALEAATGKELWKADRTGKTSWSTPVVWRNSKRVEVVTCGAGEVASYDPATGKVLWKFGKVPTAFTSSPAIDGDVIVFGTSSPGVAGVLYAVKAGGDGDLTLPADATASAFVAWSKKGVAPGMASPVAGGGFYYLTRSGGVLACHETATGKEVYRERLPGAATIAASMWLAGDRLFVLDEAGKTFVVAAGPKFELVGTNEIKDTFWSTPAAAGKTLLLRGVEKLYCVRE